MNSLNKNSDFEKDDVVWNLFLTIPSSWSAEMLSHSGFDILTLDMQHGLISYDQAVLMLQAMGERVIAMARLRWNEPSHIMQMLDAGVKGLICPMIRTASDVQEFVAACRYPPLGIRSYGPIRAKLYHQDDYLHTASDDLSIFPMVETKEAFTNLEEISNVEGITGIFVGPYDLSISMGLKSTGNIDDPVMHESLKKIVKICVEKSLVSAVFTSQPAHALKLKEMGFKLVSCGTDSDLLLRSAGARIQVLRELNPMD